MSDEVMALPMSSPTDCFIPVAAYLAGGEDGTVRVWDLRAPGCQRAYESRAAVNTVVLHPNQVKGE